VILSAVLGAVVLTVAREPRAQRDQRVPLGPAARDRQVPLGLMVDLQGRRDQQEQRDQQDPAVLDQRDPLVQQDREWDVAVKHKWRPS
jgi:hypothetical protein